MGLQGYCISCDEHYHGNIGYCWKDVWKIFGLKDHSINQSMSNGGDCRTAPATPGPLITLCIICLYASSFLEKKNPDPLPRKKPENFKRYVQT